LPFGKIEFVTARGKLFCTAPREHNAAATVMEITLIIAVCLGGWLWLDSLKAREAAVSAAREACRVEGLLLLDDTVAISSVRLAREDDGRIRLQRAYSFEYSDTGNNRLPGSVVLIGRRVVLFNVGLRDDATLRKLR
jgi:hypothetical protein